ncbi:MAG: SHOCT domain-containing protein [Spirochaetota bacterium]
MKKVLVTIIIAMLVFTGSLAADEPGEHPRLEDVVSQIVEEQGVESLSAVDLQQVDPEQLAELGDAVMARMIEDESEHQRIDELMGGEGSQRLDAMHRQLGYRYIQSGGSLPLEWRGSRMFGGGPMMNGWNNGWYGPGMMGWSPWGWIIGILIVVLVVVLVVMLLRSRSGDRGDYFGSRSSNTREDPVEIVKERYARGEITREEYQDMLEELKKKR